MKTPPSPWQDLLTRTSELADLRGVLGVLEWDQQTMMPKAGAGARGRQLSLVSGLFHERMSDPRLGELLGEVEAGDDPIKLASVRNLRRDHDRATRLPSSLVRAQAEAKARAHHAWIEARGVEDFAPFAEPLDALVQLSRQQIAALKTDQADPYDVLLEGYDPGSTVASLESTFERLAEGTRAFLGRLEGREGPSPVEAHVPVEAQRALATEVVSALGFDLDRAGRLDAAEHPFTVGMHPSDVRLTQHLYPEALLSGLTGTIHEAGHGMYEQGLPEALSNTPAGEAASFGLHESQSRFWENFIGRSLPFCRWLVGRLDRHHPGHGLSAERLFGAANRVQPSLVRIFADEVTYNLHIIVRFRLERALLSGDLPVAELPGAWEEAYAQELGVRPPSLTQGVLQDVHWSAGLFAYFPSYTLGNLYAASLSARLTEELPELWTQVEAGEFGAILAWLREKVHRHAHLLDAPEIMRQAVGERDAVADLLAHFEARQGALYVG